jgi:hypothetical protein
MMVMEQVAESTDPEGGGRCTMNRRKGVLFDGAVLCGVYSELDPPGGNAPYPQGSEHCPVDKITL